jgi:rhamnose utilization protein RhaD (predicted bifunctional aldolase and dehydrogenase)/NAD(P)-dependent dehydrogenase (short-subunit alcohol dehydrogenase family)
MKSLWNAADAAKCATPLDLRVYTSRLLGREPALVLHGGGNTSVKAPVTDLFGQSVDVLFIKGSGWDLATIEAPGFAPVRLDVLTRMATLPALSDAEMVKAQRAATVDPAAPVPSVEAILHAIIPFTYVDHTHADAVVAVSNTDGGAERIREIYGDSVLVVPYVMPGFVLARAVYQQTRGLDWSKLDGMILLNHGVFSFGPDARTSYERMIALVSKAEDYLEFRAGGGVGLDSAPAGAGLEPAARESLAGLRREVGRSLGAPVVARPELAPIARAFADRPDLARVAGKGPLTPDHVIRTKPLPLLAAGDWAAAVAGYGERYHDYFRRHAAGQTELDRAPRWIVWPGHGFVTVGRSVKDARIVADIARHTARAIDWAERLGGWRALPESDLFEVEYWELEQAKLKQAGAAPALAGKVALVTGAASGIGRAAAEALARAGAAVVATDVDPAVRERFSRDDLVGLVADATDREQVERSVAAAVDRFGGLDIVVSNAGIFSPSQRLDSMRDEVWDQSLALNLTSHLHLIRAATPFLRLGFDPTVVIVGSKNVPAPGPGAGAYSVAKAGLAQLARVAALELAGDGIRINTIHPHAVFDTGAWTPEVLAARAKHYGMSVEDYKRNNLLGVEVTTRDVAALILALVGPGFAKTTGAQIPIDGGSDRVV